MERDTFSTLSVKRPLLHTKLNMPRPRANIIPRPRLISQLNRAVAANGTLQPKLTLITSPAGYGKTTLATQWLQQLDSLAPERPHDDAPHCAWLSLDEGDNDEARFLAYLFAAVATIQAEIGAAALARLSSTYINNDTPAILTGLLNDLATCERPLLILLDDYHLIHSNAIHQAITFILDHMPLQLHLVITSRSQPPLPLALLRAQGQLNWVGSRELRFTHDEATQFLQQTMSLTLPPTDIDQLETQVEGWVTGLQLAALALQEKLTLPVAASGNQRYLVDYLADQVLERQPPAVQTFLLQTAVLNRFCAPLCDAVLNLDGSSQPLLHQIETANLFLIPLDGERRWYRYHHLFAAFLHGRLQQQHPPATIARLHQRAAHWYQAQGQPETAVDHALAAADYELAVQLIDQVAEQILMFGEGITLRRWVEALPADRQTSQPRLTLFYAWSLIRTGDLPQAKHCLEIVGEQLDTAQLWGEWAALRARLAAITGEPDINLRFSQKALAKLPADQHMLRSEVAINLGFSHLQQADIAAARAAFAEAAQNRAHDPGLWAVMFATFYWGTTYEREARLHEAYAIYEQGLATAVGDTNGRLPSPAVGFMHIGLGSILYEWNRLAEAETHLRRALRCAEQSGDHKMLIYSREALARLLATLGDWPAAAAVLARLEQQTRANSPSLKRATLALRRGDLEPMRHWQTAVNLQLTDPVDKLREWPFAYLALVRLHLATQALEPVQSALRGLQTVGETRHHHHFVLEVTLLQALALARQGAWETAVLRFNAALALAEPGGFVRLFLDEADPLLLRLLNQAAHHGVHTHYARTLLRHCGGGEMVAEETAVQPLSPRELEVLQQLASGRTNRQIAAELFISLNTVKAHTRRLYEKLHVNSRTQAVARARTLNLL